jgi:UBX domain-containing protein 1
LNLVPHKDENYKAPKKKYQPFSGQGQRLGSPTPGAGPSVAPPTTTSQPAAAPSSSATKPAEMTVDESTPTLRLQIRLGDGSRLQSRFNTTHTVGDVYEFVNRASPASTQRPYVLITTFPNKEYSDKAVVLGELDELKRGGGSLLQKWT